MSVATGAASNLNINIIQKLHFNLSCNLCRGAITNINSNLTLLRFNTVAMAIQFRYYVLKRLEKT